jgi:hypothetical protein
VLLAVQGSVFIFLFLCGPPAGGSARRACTPGIWWIAVSFCSSSCNLRSPCHHRPASLRASACTAYLVPWAMLLDVIELDELKTGRRREGASRLRFSRRRLARLGLVSVVLGVRLHQPAPHPLFSLRALFIRLMIGNPAISLPSIYLVYVPISRRTTRRGPATEDEDRKPSTGGPEPGVGINADDGSDQICRSTGASRTSLDRGSNSAVSRAESCPYFAAGGRPCGAS